MAVANGSQLGCGRDINDIWDHADAPPTAHEIGCPECQAARASLAELSIATQELRRRDRDLHLSADLVTKVTNISRAEVRRGAQIPLSHRANGTGQPAMTVSEQAIASVVRHAADQMADIEARRCSVEVMGDRSDGDRGQPVAIKIRLRIAASARTAILNRVGVLRDRLVAAVAAEVGVDARIVDIDVEDVHDA